MALSAAPTRGRSARVHQRACPRTTFGTTTFQLLVAGVSCRAAVGVVERFQARGLPPRGWACVDLVCWRGAQAYDRAPTRVQELVDVTVEPGPVSPGRCAGVGVEISARQYIGCSAARRALARYLARPGGGGTSGSLVSCNGDVDTGGFCAVTFPTGAQGHFAFAPRRGTGAAGLSASG